MAASPRHRPAMETVAPPACAPWVSFAIPSLKSGSLDGLDSSKSNGRTPHNGRTSYSCGLGSARATWATANGQRPIQQA
eukprot:4338310-Alexandrium_andersonii.AAC.2